MSHLQVSGGELPTIQLLGEDGNAFGIMAKWNDAARKAGWTKGDRESVLEHARSGDYDHLLCTIMDHSGEPDDDYYDPEDEENW